MNKNQERKYLAQLEKFMQEQMKIDHLRPVRTPDQIQLERELEQAVKDSRQKAA